MKTQTQIIFPTLGEYTVGFPKVGEMLAIEQKKMALTGNRYGAMSYTMTPQIAYALDLVDAISYFSVLIPALQQKLRVDSFEELESFTAKELVKVYREQFIVWYDPLAKQLYTDEDKKDDALLNKEENLVKNHLSDGK